ncbi:IS3 family transposase [Bacteriovorax sp. PP10]|uniref:IS3 family transposase n=1 Tax=Bacteriovorax antarcticus TaxID=3088717 RepID=A0ABU5W338_9BACT|nr:IS3 family transposase [Bacteriovorax sp. PP10]MEA9358655.1 IS3 family transposase [Bacteriovorax sp. PP10]
MSDNFNEPKKRKPKRMFTAEEKKRIVEEFLESGLPAIKFAPKYDIVMETLSKWKQDYKRAQQNPTSSTKLNAKRGGPYNEDLRRQAVEAYRKSGLSQKDFSKIWGVAEVTLGRWNSLYEKYGPKGLEGSIFQDTFRKYKERHHKRISEALQKEIIKTKLDNPTFGLRKVKDFLHRFDGLKVSTGTIRKTLVEENIPLIKVVKKRRRSSDKIRRFERARAMQLWQTDITSYVLARHSQRVYLTVFLDDNSRYIVAWSLQLRQTGEFVMNCVQDGIQKFGKPQEILTDQGRQYFSWRGKSEFQHMLDKEGIKHVVARSHHPQTVGKCERLWETIAQEFWNRARPQELSEAQERLKHYIDHYNHFRPHQGIDGMTPADRFFGVESEIRKILEESIAENALRMALDEKPKSPVFLVGQIDGKSVSLHGENGHLIFQSKEGLVSKLGEKLNLKNLEGQYNGNKAEEREEAFEKKASDDGEASDADQDSLASSERGSEEDGIYEWNDNARILGGKTHEDRSRESIEHTTDKIVADVSTSFERDVGGSFETTNDKGEGYEREARERCESFAEEDCRAGEDDRNAGSSDRDFSRDAGMSDNRSDGRYSTEGEDNCKEDTATSSRERSGFFYWRKDEK